ncbi:hypothetical protein [Candidatus Poriferisodalis sp.]|uniref:hypothetical protein n=1 Tax=Candidatus Poriferisodalis sp. TaxID=3101277 RepID=UPI003B5A73FB
MSKRSLAALCALLAFIAVLVAVPLATAETAEAHTKTVKRCSYDPFTNVQQCWYEKVAHTHRVIPDNPPPDTSPTTTTAPPPKSCPAGQHSNGGAGKNCHSHSFTPPCGTGTWSPGHGHSAIQRPPCPPPPKCADGYSGTPPNCKKIEPPKCADGYSGTPPNCVKDKPKTTTPPDCAPVTRGRGVRHQHRHALGTGSAATTSACHPVNDSHCSTGEHEHAHGSQQCHTLGQKTDNSDGDHKGWTDHCPAGEHSHEHTGGCHLEKQQAWRFPQACRGPDASVRYHNHGQGLACHPVGADLCPAGQHEHKPGIYRNVRGCHDEDTQHGSGELKQSEGHLYDAAGKIVCYGAAGVGAAAAGKLIVKGASWIAQFVAGSPVGIGVDIGCEKLFDKLEEAEKNKREQEKKDHDDDSGSGSGSGSSQQPTPDQNDPDGDYDGNGTTTAEEAHEASLRYEAGELTDAEYYRIIYKSWCDRGDSYYCGKKPPQ